MSGFGFDYPDVSVPPPGEEGFVDLNPVFRRSWQPVDLTEVLASGRHALGPGRYETLHLAGELDGHPVLTFSCPDVTELEPGEPAAAYVETMARGLRAVHGLDDEEADAYLASW